MKSQLEEKIKLVIKELLNLRKLNKKITKKELSEKTKIYSNSFIDTILEEIYTRELHKENSITFIVNDI